MFMFPVLRNGRRVSRAEVAQFAAIRFLSSVAVDVIEQNFLGAEGFSAVGELALEFSDLQVNGSSVTSEIRNGVESFPANLADPIAFVARLEMEAKLPPRIELFRTNLAEELAADFVEEGRPAHLAPLKLHSVGERFVVTSTGARLCMRSQLAKARVSVSAKFTVYRSGDLVEIVQVELQ